MRVNPPKRSSVAWPGSDGSSREATVKQQMLDRAALLHTCMGDAQARADLLYYYRTHPVDWINDWVWTYDPRNRKPIPKRLPLIMWGRQEELIEWLRDRYEEGENGLLKKGRDVGASWLCCAFSVWLWLFEADVAVTFGSRKQELVDKKGDPKSLFEKIRDIINNLPLWMLPRGYEESEHDNFLRIINPANGATITGEAGDQMGRGGRSSIYFLDEFAFVPRAERVDAAVNDNANTVIYLSTSNGVGTLFHQKEVEGHTPMFRFFWRDDPRKSPEWAEQKKREIGPVAFAKEHEGDDGAALDNILIPASWVMAAVNLDLQEGTDVVAGLDVADQGTDLNVYILRKGPVVPPDRILDWGDVLPKETARRAIAHAREDGAALHYDRIGPGSGVAGELAETVNASIRSRGIVGGESPSSVRYEDDPRKPANERFANIVTECWWSLRRRFEKTYEHVNGIATYPEDELISIPDHPVLISQLSSRLIEYTESGKIKAESKAKMARRGVKSPDHADALAYTCAPRITLPTIRGRLGKGKDGIRRHRR